MKFLQRKGRFMICRSEDGCWRENLTTVIPTLSATRRTMRELVRMGYNPENLYVLDLDTTRFISFVW